GALATLRRRGDVLDRIGDEVVRGTPTTHWRVRNPKVPAPPDCLRTKLTITNTPPAARPHHQKPPRRRRAGSGQQTPEHGNSADEMHVTTTTEFFDFGVAVDVHEPAANDTTDATDWWIALSKGTGTVDNRGWRVGANGTINGEPFTVFYAKTTTGQ